MNSKSKDFPEGQRILQQLPAEAKGAIEHVFNNGLFIIRGLAQQTLESPSADDRVKARIIMKTVDDLVAQKREMLYGGNHGNHLGAVEKEPVYA